LPEKAPEREPGGKTTAGEGEGTEAVAAALYVDCPAALLFVAAVVARC
jgi:hypothetical protein